MTTFASMVYHQEVSEGYNDKHTVLVMCEAWRRLLMFKWITQLHKYIATLCNMHIL